MFNNQFLFTGSVQPNQNKFKYRDISPPAVIIEEDEQKGESATFQTDTSSRDFKFKYVSEDAFSRIVNQVQQMRKKSQEQKEWMKNMQERIKEDEEKNASQLQVKSTMSPKSSEQSPLLFQSQICTDQNNQCREPQQIYINHTEYHNYEEESEDDKNIHNGKYMEPTLELPECNCLCNQNPSNYKTPYNSSSSDDENVQKMNAPESRPERSVHISRIFRFRRSILSCMETICELIYKIPKPDGVDDLKRRERRANEFSSWISRNYHYKLKRQIYDIKRQMLNNCPGAWNTFQLVLYKKMAVAHQTASQALQAYVHHLPSSVGTGVLCKLQELFKFIQQLSHCNRKLGIIEMEASNSAEDEILKQTYHLLSILKPKTQFNSDMEEMHAAESKSMTGKIVTKKNHKADLSMYEPRIKRVGKMQGLSWKKSVSKLAKAKFGSPPNAQQTGKFQASTKVTESTGDNKKSGMASNTATNSSSKQHQLKNDSVGEVCAVDNIETMMDIIPLEECEEEESVNENGGMLKLAEAPVVDSASDKYNGGVHSEESIIDNMIDLSTAVLHEMREETKKFKAKSRSDTTSVSFTTCDNRDTDSSSKVQPSNSVKIDVMTLKRLEEVMSQMNQYLPKSKLQQFQQDSKQNDCFAKYERRSRHTSRHSSCKQSKKESQNAKLIFIEHNSADELQMTENTTNLSHHNVTSKSTDLSVREMDPESCSCCSDKDHVSNSSSKSSLYCQRENSLLKNESVNLHVPSNWEPNTRGKLYECKNGVHILEHRSQHKAVRNCAQSKPCRTQSDMKIKHPNTPVSDKDACNTKETSMISLEQTTSIKQNCRGVLKTGKFSDSEEMSMQHNSLMINEQPIKLEKHDNERTVVKTRSNFKNEAVPLVVSSAAQAAISDYHMRFRNYQSTKSKYGDSGKAWILITRIANNLCHDALNHVVKNEVGVNKITKRLMEMEFQ